MRRRSCVMSDVVAACWARRGVRRARNHGRIWRPVAEGAQPTSGSEVWDDGSSSHDELVKDRVVQG